METKSLGNIDSLLKPDVENPVVLDGEPKITAVRRANIKLATHPEIVIAIPNGRKEVGQVFKCPADQGGCDHTWFQNGFSYPYLVPFQFLVAFMNMIMPLNCTVAYCFEPNRLSAEARQIMTKKAIRMGAKYILYWDDDTLPPEMGLFTMHTWMEMHPEVGAISGIYTTRTNPPVPLIFEQHGRGAAWSIPMGPGAEPVPIFGAGAGFLLARVDAIKDTIAKMAIANNGQEVAIWQDVVTRPAKDAPERAQFTTTWGRDVRFCKLLNEHGWPVYAHGNVLCGHYDIETSQVFEVPTTAPGFQHANA
jgi:hypothetical protein